MPRSPKWIVLGMLVVAFVVLGYLRDFFFINLNYHLYHIQNNTRTSDAHSFFDFLHNFSFWQVYISKYLLTAIFTVVNFFLGLTFLHALFEAKPLLKWYSWIYVLVIAISGLFFAGGYVLGNPEGGYYFSRILMGFLQSPVPAALMAFAYPLYLQSRSM